MVTASGEIEKGGTAVGMGKVLDGLELTVTATLVGRLTGKGVGVRVRVGSCWVGVAGALVGVRVQVGCGVTCQRVASELAAATGAGEVVTNGSSER